MKECGMARASGSDIATGYQPRLKIYLARLAGCWPVRAVGSKLKIIDIHTDDGDGLMAAVLAVLPDSEVKKRGNKGFSAFYQGHPAIVSSLSPLGNSESLIYWRMGGKPYFPLQFILTPAILITGWAAKPLKQLR